MYIKTKHNSNSSNESTKSSMHGTCTLRLALGEWVSNFNLEKAICNHGFFMMSPNCWIPSTKSFQRPLRLADSITSVNVSISHQDFLIVHVNGVEYLSFEDQETIQKQVERMLRITKEDERMLHEFQQIHAQAKHRGFGRLFRSPSLFEDIVKSILLCNCTWERTLSMAGALCDVQAELNLSSTTNRLRNTVNKNGNFPSSREIANMKEDFLEERCGLGYRAKYILQFAKNVESGKINLNKFEEAVSSNQVYKALKNNKGFGRFVCANVLLCIGFYEKVPIDTETVRHLQEVHSKESCTMGTIDKHVKEIYDKYAPFQSLAYWMELLESYENKFGKLSELDNSNYHIVSRSRPSISSSKLK